MGAAIRELKKNRILITQCDEIEEWRPSRNEKMSFLGRITGVDRTINILGKRTGAEIVFGVIHRYTLSSYELMLFDYEDLSERVEKHASASAGENLLKFLEHFIYAFPEQWYQWKKYADLRSLPVSNIRDKRFAGPLLPRPSYGVAL